MTLSDAALYRLLTLRPASYPGRDGADLVRESFDDSQFLRDVAKQMLGDLHSGDVDHAELGRIVWDRIQCFAEGLPRFDDALAVEDEDNRARRLGVGA